jgi:hypothetical protein
MAGSSIHWREPGDPERTKQHVYGPRVTGTCSLCHGPMEESVAGISYHVGPCCHWHEKGTGCCEFIADAH